MSDRWSLKLNKIWKLEWFTKSAVL